MKEFNEIMHESILERATIAALQGLCANPNKAQDVAAKGVVKMALELGRDLADALYPPEDPGA